MFRKRVFIFCLILILLGILSIYYPKLTGKGINIKEENYKKELVFIREIIDGDTIEMDNGEKIRLFGINTPEKGKYYYDEAKDFLKEIENQTIFVLRDREDYDRYNRMLRYVFYEDRLLNIEILEKGFATCFMIEDLKYKEKLEKAEKFARDNEVGLWEKSKEICARCIDLVELNFKEEFFILKNKCGFDCDLKEWSVKDDANHFFRLELIKSNNEKKFESKGNIWNDNGDRFFMRDRGGKLVLFYGY